MKRSGPPARKTPLRSTTGIKRTAMSRKPSVKQREHIKTMAELRLQCFARDRHACVRCGAEGPGVYLQAHHRKPTGVGGEDTLANLVTLCGPAPAGCHGYVHDHPQESYANGLLLRSWDRDPTEAWKR